MKNILDKIKSGITSIINSFKPAPTNYSWQVPPKTDVYPYNPNDFTGPVKPAGWQDTTTPKTDTSGGARDNYNTATSSAYSTDTSASSAGNPLQSSADMISNAYQSFLDNYASKVKDFDAANPFSFDEVLATKRTEVSQRLDPWYTQTLDDYLRGVTLKRNRGLSDERTLLSELSADTETYIGRNKQLLDEAKATSAEGYADSGLFFSGSRMRKGGMLESESGQTLQSYLTTADRAANKARLGTSRTMEDLAIDESTKRRDLERQKYADVESASLNETNLAQMRRNLEKAQYLGSPFASSSLSSLPSNFSSLLS